MFGLASKEWMTEKKKKKTNHRKKKNLASSCCNVSIAETDEFEEEPPS